MTTKFMMCCTLLGTYLAAVPLTAQTVSLELVSGVAFQPGDPVDHDAIHRFLSRDGRFLGVHTRGTIVMPGIVDLNAVQDAYLFDLQSGDRRLVSSRWDDPQRTSQGASFFFDASQDGRYVVVLSSSTDLLPPPAAIAGQQLVLLDLQSGDRDLITAKAADPATGSAGAVVSSIVRMSEDGRYVAFVSDANDLVAGVTIAPGSKNLFLYDRSTGQTRLVTLKAGSATLSANGEAFLISLSADGRYVTYISTASDQVAATDGNGQNDVFQWDRDTGAITLITREVGGNAAGGNATAATPTGRHVVLNSSSTQLVAGFVDGAGSLDVYLWDRNSNGIILVSGALGSPTAGGNGTTGARGISDDSRLIALGSAATDLIPGFVDNNGAANTDAFLVNRQTGARTLVSRKDGTTNQGANGASASSPMPLSADGRYAYYFTRATDIDDAVVDTNGRGDLYRFDHTTGDHLLASRVGSSTQAGAGQYFGLTPLASADASLVVFDVNAPNAVNSRQQVGLFNAATETASLASSTPLTGTAAAGRSIPAPFLSRTGRFAAWNTFSQGWLYDARAKSSSRLSFPAGQPSLPANGQSHAIVMSDDARYVVLSTTGTDLVNGASDANDAADVVLLDRATQTTSLISHVAGNPLQALAGASDVGAMSADGRYVLFQSDADAVVSGVTGETEGKNHLYVYDRQSDLSQLIDRSWSNATQVANNGASVVDIVFGSGGRHIIFQSLATDLVPGFIDNNVGSDIYWFDRDTAEMILVSKRPGAAEAGSSQVATPVKLSNDGRWLIYNNRAMDLIPGGVPSGTHIRGFLFDRATRTHSLIASAPGTPTEACTATPPAGDITNTSVLDLSAEGRFVLFESHCQLVAGDTNQVLDVYVLDRNNQTYQLISHLPGNPGQSKGIRARAARISGDGRFVVYSIADGPAYRYDRSSQQETLISFAPLDGDQPVPANNLRPSEDFSRILLTSATSTIVPYDSGDSDAFLATFVDLFADGFESGDTSAWSAAVP